MTTFVEWFDIVIDHLRAMGYTGPVLKESFVEAFDNEEEPEDAAQDFFDEITAEQ